MNESSNRLDRSLAWFRQVVDRVAGLEGVAALVSSTSSDRRISDQQVEDLADLVDVASERVRFTRTAAPEVTNPQPPSHVETRLPLNRKERFYTGTVLPMLVASDGFAHLHRLLSLCGLQPGLPLRPTHGSLEGDDEITFFTEYGFGESVFTPADREAWPDDVEGDTPDIVVVGADWLLAIEAKMFHNPNRVALEAQMRRQAALVTLWAHKLHLDPTRVRHVLLLPQPLAHRVGELAYPVVTWEQMLESYRTVGPRYWVRVLSTALDRHGELVSRTGTGGANADAVMTGSEIVAAHADSSLSHDHVGRIGGLHGAAFQADLQTHSWRSTRYEVRTGALPGRKNWFPVAEFIAATANAVPGDASATDSTKA